MKTGAEIVLEWFRKYAEQNGTPTPFEVTYQLELAIESDKNELKKLRLGNITNRKEQLIDFAEWCAKGNFTYYFNGKEWMWAHANRQEYYTSEELFDKWKKRE